MPPRIRSRPEGPKITIGRAPNLELETIRLEMTEYPKRTRKHRRLHELLQTGFGESLIEAVEQKRVKKEEKQ